jgi:putative DNA primase/helicase
MSNNLNIKARLSEKDMADLLKDHLGDTFYYLENLKKWVFFEVGKGWVEEREEELRSKQFYGFLNKLYNAPSSIPKEKVEAWEKHRWSCIHNYSDQNGVRRVFDVLRNDTVLRKGEYFDTEPHLLGAGNGIVDLRSGKLFPPSKKLLVTQKSPINYDPKAKAVRWRKFVQEVLPKHHDYIQKVMGYCVTGETNLQKLWMFVGAGSNGKSTFIENIMDVVGFDYSQKTPQNSILASSNTSSASPELTRMKSKRLIVLSETDFDAKLNETNVKQLTGNDTITARDLYSGYVQFKSVGKFVMATNHLPKVTSNGVAIWRRIEVIRFDSKFNHNSDPLLASKLANEQEGILAWLVEGAKWFYSKNRDLKSPTEILDWINEYRAEEDVLSGFLSERVEDCDGNFVTAKTFYDEYRDWCRNNSISALDANLFGRDLTKRGFARKKMGRDHKTNYLNIKLKEKHFVKTSGLDVKQVRKRKPATVTTKRS